MVSQAWSLSDFLQLIEQSHKVKRKIFAQVRTGKKVSEKLIKKLVLIKEIIESMPQEDGKFIFSAPNTTIRRTLSYQLAELQKDIIFLIQGEDALFKHLAKIHKNFDKEVKAVLKTLNKDIALCVTDRDGTINNYSEQHKTSVQSVYNAAFIDSFFQEIKQAIILTSAPLTDTLKVSLLKPTKDVVFAASKGREYQSTKYASSPLEKEQSKLLKKLQKNILNLLKEKEYAIFSMIGSGFQLKYGQLTLARQDISSSIEKSRSLALLNKVKELVKMVDPHNKAFTIEDTGLDIEIILTTSTKEEFDKGLGVKFVREQLHMATGQVFCCGDTGSDLPIFREHPDCIGVFVTTNNALKKKVLKVCPQTVIVSSPDVLVSAMRVWAKKEGR